MERGIYFDEDYQIRVLDADKYLASKGLQDNCKAFLDNAQQLQSIVSKNVAAVQEQAERIELEKLKAVGLRNRVAALHEEHQRREQELTQLLVEKQAELDRLQLEEQYLSKAIQEQELTIAKLADSSSGQSLV